MKSLALAGICLLAADSFADTVTEIGPEKIIDLFEAINSEITNGQLKVYSSTDCQFRVDRSKKSVEITYKPSKEETIKIGPFSIEENSALTTRHIGSNIFNSRSINIKAVPMHGSRRIILDFSSYAYPFPRNESILRIYVYEPKLHNDFLGEVLNLTAFEQTGKEYTCGWYTWDMK